MVYSKFPEISRLMNKIIIITNITTKLKVWAHPITSLTEDRRR